MKVELHYSVPPNYCTDPNPHFYNAYQTLFDIKSCLISDCQKLFLGWGPDIF